MNATDVNDSLFTADDNFTGSHRPARGSLADWAPRAPRALLATQHRDAPPSSVSPDDKRRHLRPTEDYYRMRAQLTLTMNCSQPDGTVPDPDSLGNVECAGRRPDSTGRHQSAILVQDIKPVFRDGTVIPDEVWESLGFYSGPKKRRCDSFKQFRDEIGRYALCRLQPLSCQSHKSLLKYHTDIGPKSAVCDTSSQGPRSLSVDQWPAQLRPVDLDEGVTKLQDYTECGNSYACDHGPGALILSPEMARQVRDWTETPHSFHQQESAKIVGTVCWLVRSDLPPSSPGTPKRGLDRTLLDIALGLSTQHNVTWDYSARSDTPVTRIATSADWNHSTMGDGRHHQHPQASQGTLALSSTEATQQAIDDILSKASPYESVPTCGSTSENQKADPFANMSEVPVLAAIDDSGNLRRSSLPNLVDGTPFDDFHEWEHYGAGGDDETKGGSGDYDSPIGEVDESK
ncbi:hypothetical protein IAT40_008013 [Kwoniella sp. CBS 6097]